ncbi:zinc finger CCCH domain-containing protein 14 isoform X7 [Salmo salar]|uniref:Zinc finger CCCH domain-containing protein 14 n=1 Tax=Salmo salar TaxID=8030 RepID=A0ABM3F1D4_SALSA|nr:zinc finger CCCH domain-containing protein 14 isoform X7 [Salmo salar]|eukprot:XP_014061611.1 PREDICTED: zinc finger CCCH domain-containing protein 14-like isoform X5 [Salmo salar]
MEIGTEISKKIRAAIKGKLQELGAYVDEELPDYIMVMVANKKTSQQMSDDLSLFLGNNTIKFTVWLHGVLEKLRSVAVEPASLRPQLYSDTGTSSGKSEWKGEESKGLAVSSSRSDRTEARVSSSAHEHRRVSSDKTSSSRLTSTVKPLMDPPSSEAVIDIKPELDDDLIGEDPVDMGVLPGRLRGSTSGGGGRASAQIYRPPQGRSSSGTGRSADAYRSSEGSSGSHSRQQHSSYHLDSRSSRDSRPYREGGSSRQQEEASRKRKAPVVSSVVRVNQAADGGRDSDEEEDDEEDDEGYGVKNLSSRVSLPSKPERKPSLPPAKQANKNLLLRAMSEAQISINKTAAYPPIPQRQTVPVAPRTRSTTDEMNAAIQLVQEHLHGLVPRGQSYTPSEPQPPRQLVQSRSLASRLQLDVPEDNMRAQHSDYLALEVAEGSVLKPFDTRSFIVRRPELEEELVPVRSRLGQLDKVPMTSRLGLEEVPPPMRSGLEEVAPPMRSRLGLEEVAPPMRSRREETTVPMRSRLGAMVKEEIQPATPRMVQPASSEKAEAVGSASPKFIVTLDGVPSPLGNLGDCDMETDDSYPKPTKTIMPDPSIHLGTKPKLSIHHRLQGEPQYPDELGMETEEEEEVGPVKRQKVLERCKFWPVCKTGDECVYHHPTTQCKTFPSCKFGDKCLFVHPNCKFDGKCSKPDCPFTHVSRRGPAPYTPPIRPVPPVQTSSVCRFFPECKKMDCLFYHPKPCRFGVLCKHTGCTFYHPTAPVPPRHALKWTKAQSS